MNDNDDEFIPAASIGDTDLDAVAWTKPDAAREIARLEDLMDRGDETKDDFLRLCQLLVDVGSTADTEHLLRRNLTFYDGKSLYNRLFGSEKPDEFNMAVSAFESHFGLNLELIEENDFLVSTFRFDGGKSRTDDFQLLSRPCEVRIGYIERERCEADVVLHDPEREMVGADECLLMYFLNGVWELADDADV